MRMRNWLGLFAAICCLAAVCAQQSAWAKGAPEVVLHDELKGYFTAFEAGTFVLYDEANDRYTIYNEPQSEKRLSPCSTFKLFHGLIGLETGVLEREDARTLRKWDGVSHRIPGWNHDQTLASAIRGSVVWYFKDLAARIGAERMQANLDKIGYGNRDLSGGLTAFWLGSSLRISAREQVDLLQKLYAGQLPVAAENVEIIKRDSTLHNQNHTRLTGKTGTNMQEGRLTLGWFVGSVEKSGKRYSFAVNLEAADGATGAAAREIAEAILRDMGLLE